MGYADIATNIFMALAKDSELLNLLGVPTTDMVDIRKQIIEDRQPYDLVENPSSRLCVFENPSTPTPSNAFMEKGWIEIDIYVIKQTDEIDRRTVKIADHIIESVDSDKRIFNGLKPIVAGINLSYYNRLPNMLTDRPEWKKYGIVFCYDYVKK